MRSRLLEGLMAVDLTTEIAWDCGRVLASFGAEVFRVDLPDAMTTLRDDAASRLRWGLGQTGKLRTTLDYSAPHGREALLEMIDRADLLIESFAPGRMAELGLPYEALARRRPGLIQVSITPFGQTGPYSGYKGAELVVAAMSSLLELNGDADRPPVREPRSAHLFHACAAGVTAAVFALRERERSGRGQWIDISAQEVGASRNTAWILAAQFDDRHAARNGPYLNLGRTGSGNRTIWRLKDGYAAWQISPPQSPQTRAFAAWMDELAFSRPPDDLGAGDAWTAEAKAAWESAIAAFLAERTRAEIMSEGYRRGCDAAAVNTPADLLDDPQFAARGLFGPPDEAIPGAPRLPTYFIRTTCEAPVTVGTPVPAAAP